MRGVTALLEKVERIRWQAVGGRAGRVGCGAVVWGGATTNMRACAVCTKDGSLLLNKAHGVVSSGFTSCSCVAAHPKGCDSETCALPDRKTQPSPSAPRARTGRERFASSPVGLADMYHLSCWQLHASARPSILTLSPPPGRRRFESSACLSTPRLPEVAVGAP